MKKLDRTPNLESIWGTIVFFINMQIVWLWLLFMNKFFGLWINSITNELIPLFNLVYAMIFLPFFYYILLLFYFFNFTSIMNKITIFKILKFFLIIFFINFIIYIITAFITWDFLFLFPIWDLHPYERLILLLLILFSWIVSLWIISE